MYRLFQYYFSFVHPTILYDIILFYITYIYREREIEREYCLLGFHRVAYLVAFSQLLLINDSRKYLMTILTPNLLCSFLVSPNLLCSFLVSIVYTTEISNPSLICA